MNAVALAHSLIRSFPEIDAEKTGVTGISWGGYLTSIVAGVDSRFKFAAPVYGCGFLGDNSAWLPAFEKMGEQNAQRWLRQWDPSVYLPDAMMPILWLNGTNDFAYPMDSWQKSYRLPKGSRQLCLRIRMPHGHGAAGENPEEIHLFANSLFNQQSPLAVISEQGMSKDQLWADYTSATPIVEAELAFTKSAGKWQERMWDRQPAMIDTGVKRVSATIPDGATAFYLNLIDDRGCVVSSEHVER